MGRTNGEGMLMTMTLALLACCATVPNRILSLFLIPLQIREVRRKVEFVHLTVVFLHFLILHLLGLMIHHCPACELALIARSFKEAFSIGLKKSTTWGTQVCIELHFNGNMRYACAFVLNGTVVEYSWMVQVLFKDLDGTLAGVPGGWVTPANGLLPLEYCRQLPEYSLNAKFPGSVCTANVSLLRLAWNNAEPIVSDKCENQKIGLLV